MAERAIEHTRQTGARKLAFIDVEASGLGSKSWPVEVGWAFEEGEPQAFMIRPHDSWTDESWDPQAERLHGLDRARLEREGLAPVEVCRALNEAFAGAEVYSDAPDWDGFWLFRLFSAAGVRQGFALRDFAWLMRHFPRAHEAAVLAGAARLAPRRHRAAADARHLQTLYRLARESCDPRLTP